MGKKTSSFRLDVIIVVIFGCLEKMNYEDFKFCMNDFSYFEINTSIFLAPSSNKHRISNLQNE